MFLLFSKLLGFGVCYETLEHQIGFGVVWTGFLRDSGHVGAQEIIDG